MATPCSGQDSGNRNGASISRRAFLSGAVALAATAGALGARSFARSLPIAATPPRSRGTAVISVRDTGAFGDGVHDDTSAIQAAIAALPATGGTVYVPAGTYLIDTTRRINLRSLMLLSLDPGAVLKAKTSSVSRAYILYVHNVSDVEVAGGQLVGERDTHVYMTTSTDEWNHGIQIAGGTRVTVRDLRVSQCTGDGICIGGGSADVVIGNVVSTQNRRQGLSITNCSNIRVYDSEFSYTHGTSPECGIDIEPDVGFSCADVWIENCNLVGNAKYGINVYQRASGITLVRNHVQQNGSCGVVTSGCGPVRITQNAIHDNSATGVLLQDGTIHCLVDGNLSYGNYNRLGAVTRPPFTQVGWSAAIERDILLRGELSDVVIGSNDYR